MTPHSLVNFSWLPTPPPIRKITGDLPSGQQLISTAPQLCKCSAIQTYFTHIYLHYHCLSVICALHCNSPSTKCWLVSSMVLYGGLSHMRVVSIQSYFPNNRYLYQSLLPVTIHILASAQHTKHYVICAAGRYQSSCQQRSGQCSSYWAATTTQADWGQLACAYMLLVWQG